MAFFNEILKAGTGYLQGKTSGLQYDREEQRKNLEAKRKALHNTIEVAYFKDRKKTSALNRELAIDENVRAKQRQRSLGYHLPLTERIGRTGEAELDVELIANEALQEQTVGFAEDTDRRFREDIERTVGMPVDEALTTFGGTIARGPAGAQFTPKMLSDVEREQQDLNLENLDLKTERNYNLLQREVAETDEWFANAPYRRVGDKLSMLQEIARTEVAEIEADIMKANQGKLTKAETAELDERIARATAAVQRLRELDEMDLPPGLTPEGAEAWVLGEAEHERRMVERTTPRPPTYQYSGLTPEKAAVERMKAEADLTSAQAEFIEAQIGALTAGTDAGGSKKDRYREAAAKWLDARRTGDRTQQADALESMEALLSENLDEAEVQRRLKAAVQELESTFPAGGGEGPLPEKPSQIEDALP